MGKSLRRVTGRGGSNQQQTADGKIVQKRRNTLIRCPRKSVLVKGGLARSGMLRIGYFPVWEAAWRKKKLYGPFDRNPPTPELKGKEDKCFTSSLTFKRGFKASPFYGSKGLWDLMNRGRGTDGLASVNVSPSFSLGIFYPAGIRAEIYLQTAYFCLTIKSWLLLQSFPICPTFLFCLTTYLSFLSKKISKATFPSIRRAPDMSFFKILQCSLQAKWLLVSLDKTEPHFIIYAVCFLCSDI